MTGLYVPALDPDASVDEAAMAYASAGWYVLPIDPGTKHAGSVLGKGWPAKSSRDPKQIYAWFAGSRDGLALHVGRSGAVVFDVDSPADMPSLLTNAIESLAPPFQSSRIDDARRGHYLFAAPTGRDFSNGAGKLRGSWGEVRGRNGIIVVFPTRHSKERGHYAWVTSGELPPLPDSIAALLPDATDADAAATDAETVAFLVGHSAGNRIDLTEALFESIEASLSAGVSRHSIFVDVTSWAMREAYAGLYPAPGVADRLRQRFVVAMASSRDGVERTLDPVQASGEFVGILAWSVAQAKQSTPAEVRAGLNGRLTLSTMAPLTPLAVMQEGARRLTLTRASSIITRRVRWGWADRMPLGELILIPGREGVGKSIMLAWLTAQLTRGTLPGEFLGTPRDVLYVASEDSWSYTIAPRMVAAGANLDRVHKVDAVEAGSTLAVTLPVDCDLAGDLALDVHAAALMLDPIISLIDDRLSVNQSSELRRALEPLRRTAERAEIMIPALAHFNKMTDVDVLSRIPGGRAWTEVARAALGIAEDKEAECFIVSQIKNNLGRVNLPNLTYQIEEVLIDTEDGPTSVGKLRWTGETDVDVSEVLARKQERRSRDTSDVTKTVVDFVERCGRPVALAEVYGEFPSVAQATIRQVLHREVSQGKLTNPLRGHYGPQGMPCDRGGVSP